MDRREFLKAASAAAFFTSLGQKPTFAAVAGGMPYRTLGHTGEKVSLLGIGGHHIGRPTVPEVLAIQIIRAALDAGVNFLDNAWNYNEGVSEERMGKALRDGYRAKAFLMTKLEAKDAKAAAQLDQSLQRLQTDHIDLVQIHDIRAADQPGVAFGPGGVIEVLLAAKKAGKVRYIGFTGHKKPEFHLKMLEAADQHGFLFDTVQMPLNPLDAHYDSFGQHVLPVLVKKNIGVLGMKPVGEKFILKTGTVTALECFRFAMSLPVSVCITGCESMEILEQGLNAARNFRPLSSAEIEAMLAKTEAVAADGKFEPYKTTAW
jgi:aryl-alcohol dehydrogenase-like predicted oxidoreductase